MSSENTAVYTADWYETLAEAIEYFDRQFIENSSIESAFRRVYWDLTEGIGYQGDNQHTFSGDCETIHEWICDLSFEYDAVVAVDLETDEQLWANKEYIYASDHKAAIVGKEVAKYV